MILHVSMPADDPVRVGGVLARLMGGRDFAFPYAPGGRLVLAGDAAGTAVIVVPRTLEIARGEDAIEWRPAATPAGRLPVHVALGTALDSDRVIATAEAEGWPARLVSRGPFATVEVWVEDRFLVEFVPEGSAAAYAEAMSFRTWDA